MITRKKDRRRTLALAPCSLPVSSVDRLRKKWHARAIHFNDMANRVGESSSPWNAGRYRIMAEQWDKAAEDLRAEMEAANERQPEENRSLSSARRWLWGVCSVALE